MYKKSGNIDVSLEYVNIKLAAFFLLNEKKAIRILFLVSLRIEGAYQKENVFLSILHILREV